MRVFGLIGFPLEHSFSGKYFEHKFRSLGLSDHTYNLYPLETLDKLRAWANHIEGLVGLNVTIPHKRAVIPFLDEWHLPDGLNACNCIHIVDGTWIGYNTDVIGFSDSLKPLLKAHHTKALVLGHGGAADAVIHVLDQIGISYRVVGRRSGPGIDLLYENLSAADIKEHTLLIQTTPLGTYPRMDECPAIPYHSLGPDHLLYDLVYNPSKTMFLRKGEANGAATQSGLRMLELQAEAAWSIWNGGSFR